MEPIILPRISDRKPLVSVVSITYNHESYIRDCLEGFLMQKTDFPVEVIVHDDASTDRTADILREYYRKRPDLFHIIIQRENRHSKHLPIVLPLYNMASGKYIALCEGDDYWTDPLKLQKQFDLMESNPSYSGVFHDCKVYQESTGAFMPEKQIYQNRKVVGLDDVIKNAINGIHTCSFFFRKDSLQELAFFKKKCPVGDYPRLLCLASRGPLGHIEEEMSTYRFCAQSSWTQKYCTSNSVMIHHAKKCICWLNGLRERLKDHGKAIAISKGYYYQVIYLAQNNKKAILRNKYCRKYLLDKPAGDLVRYLVFTFFPDSISGKLSAFYRAIKKRVRMTRA